MADYITAISNGKVIITLTRAGRKKANQGMIASFGFGDATVTINLDSPPPEIKARLTGEATGKMMIYYDFSKSIKHTSYDSLLTEEIPVQIGTATEEINVKVISNQNIEERVPQIHKSNGISVVKKGG